MQQFGSILVVGLGNMAGALVDGWLASGLDPANFTAVDPLREASPAGIELLREVPQGHFDLILLGVKPQMLGEVAPALEALAGPDSVVLSILAGVGTNGLRARFPRARAIVRLMPNLAAALGKSANTLFSDDLDADGRAALTALVARLGTTGWVDDEDLFHAVTALAGSGPGFVYRFIEALAEGGSALGLAPDLAERLAVQMVEGAACLAADAGIAPAELARRVASKGGTTEAGLEVLDENRALADLVKQCLRSATERSRELSAN